MTPIRNMDYAYTSSRKGLRGSGLDVGEKVLVVGTKALPEKRSDPYLQRIYVVVVRVVDGIHQIPNSGEEEEDNGFRSYLVDPRCLTRLDDEEQERLRDMLSEQYEEK